MPWHWIGKMNCGGRSSAMERVKEAGTPNLVGQAMAREHASSMQQAVTYSYEEDPFAATTIERSSGPRPADREELFPLCGKKLPKSSGIGAGYCPQRLIIASRFDAPPS